MEALIGATYLSNDLETATPARDAPDRPLLQDAAALGAGTDRKTSIQELAPAASSERSTISSRAPARTTRVHSKLVCGSRHRLRHRLGKFQEGSRAGSRCGRLAQTLRTCPHPGHAPTEAAPAESPKLKSQTGS